ncbi:Putative outer membrane protein [Minicystis rosea]|nr:Putative outer membrane protein [Minicystis rosea]
MMTALPLRSAQAQVNIEALRSDIQGRKSYVAAQASYNGHAGNVSGSVVSAAAFAALEFGRNLTFVKLQGDYAQFNGEPTIAKAFAHLRYNYRILPFLFAEAFAQVEADKFQRLALRQLDGLGLRFAIVRHDLVQVYYGTAWMFDYSRLNDDEGQLSTFRGPSWIAQRWSNYAAVSVRVGARGRFADTLYVQPRFNDFSDLRLLNDASFALDIDKRFSAKISSQVRYNSTPPSRVKSTDVDTLTSLVVTF